MFSVTYFAGPTRPKELNKLIVGKLLVDEDRVVRPVAPMAYFKYAKLASFGLVILVFLLHILRMGCICFADVWLALWTDRALPSGGLTAYIINDTFMVSSLMLTILSDNIPHLE